MPTFKSSAETLAEGPTVGVQGLGVQDLGVQDLGD